ncbi:hypothetical protein ACFY5J_24105 [Peribacillus butanolivorans]|uniref:hypothetical protein n=1 Tax=Peribacillus butanolivorans TaxID=421767 RepID=UPI0036ABE145
MKIISLFVALFLCLFVVSGCTSTKVQEPQNQNKLSLPEDIPNFVTEKDFEKIDWDRTAIKFDTGTSGDMVGNKNKLGIIGPELKPNEVEKWLWHFWGIDKGELTIVGYNQDTSNISPVLSDGVWSRTGVGGGKINGADASLPSNVALPKAGKWALLVYIDGKLFDTLVMDIKEKPSLELVDANVDIVKDKSLLGSIEITEGERKGDEMIPTALFYEFTIKNTGNRTVGIGEVDKGIELKIEPKDKLKSVSEDVIGFNIYNPEDYNESGVGFGHTFPSVLKSDQKSKYTLNYDLGVSEENSQVPLHVPSKEKLDELKEYAFNAFLVVTIENQEIARFDLDKLKN